MAARQVQIRQAAVIALLLACVAGSQALVDAYRPIVNDEAGVTFSVAATVVRSFTGQIRGLLADYLWLRVDEYQHRRRIVGGELLKSDDEALMPLVRLITWLNPHYVDAYALGGQWLAFHFNRPRESMAFYEEGIRNNPRSFDLLNGAAWVYWRFQKDYTRAAERARDAAAVAQDDLQRFQALWLEAHILEDAGDRAGAIRAWQEVARIPGYDRTAADWIAKLSTPAPASPAPAPATPAAPADPVTPAVPAHPPAAPASPRPAAPPPEPTAAPATPPAPAAPAPSPVAPSATGGTRQ
jgi:hypothetical protein